MTEFYTKIFVGAWSAVLAMFTFGSFAFLLFVITESAVSEIKSVLFYLVAWLGVAVILGATSIGISAYNKLSRLVELKEKEISNSENLNHNPMERNEPTL